MERRSAEEKDSVLPRCGGRPNSQPFVWDEPSSAFF